MPKLDPSHYERHQGLVPLEAIQDQKVMLIGCGSLGSVIGRLLARLGIIRFHLIDPAAVTPLHLNRMAYTEDQVGHNKAAALASILNRIHKRVRCITTAKAFEKDHLTPGRETVIIITTSDPRLPPKILDGLGSWPREKRPVVLVARHAGLTGGYWLADLAEDTETNWPSDLPWLSLRDPPKPAEEIRVTTTASFAAAIATQALIDHLISRIGSSALPINVRRQVEFDLGAIVHQRAPAED
jgi:hypothetical protein